MKAKRLRIKDAQLKTLLQKKDEKGAKKVFFTVLKRASRVSK